MFRRLPVTALLALLVSSAAYADEAELDIYRVGDEWGKTRVTQESVREASPVFQRTAKATARINSATGFYLGKFGEHHVVATNHHVCPARSRCLGKRAIFDLIGRAFPITKYFGTWDEIDLTLLAIEVTDEKDSADLAAVAGNFDFGAELYPSQQLLTIGYGIFRNEFRELMAGQDSDCKVFSARGEYRLMGDPDTMNPAPYKAWSFATGCDASHGDSGSAFVDRVTGKVVGILWTGRVPKAAETQSSAALDALFARGGEEIWADLTYAVPASKVGEILQKVSDDEATRVETREMLHELLRR